MRILSGEQFKQGIVSNVISHNRLMFIGIVILQAWRNEGILQNKTLQSSKYNHNARLSKEQ